MATERDKSILNMLMNPLMPTGNVVEPEAAEVDYSMLENYEESHNLELEGIKLAEGKEYTLAIQKFTEAIQRCPTNPSAYNNRAQAFQFLRQTDEALKDIECALKHSQGRGKTAGQAYAQRAVINRCHGRTEEAKADYEKAAALGNKFAKMELAAMNPYAAMCNQMLSDVMGRLKNGEV